MLLIFLIILIIIAIGGLPNVSSHPWGYGPSGLIGIVLLVLVLLIIFGRV